MIARKEIEYDKNWRKKEMSKYKRLDSDDKLSMKLQGMFLDSLFSAACKFLCSQLSRMVVTFRMVCVKKFEIAEAYIRTFNF